MLIFKLTIATIIRMIMLRQFRLIFALNLKILIKIASQHLINLIFQISPAHLASDLQHQRYEHRLEWFCIGRVYALPELYLNRLALEILMVKGWIIRTVLGFDLVAYGLCVVAQVIRDLTVHVLGLYVAHPFTVEDHITEDVLFSYFMALGYVSQEVVYCYFWR